MNNTKIFLSRILYLSHVEKQKGIEGNSNICKFYSINELKNILTASNKKTYYEHLVTDDYLRLVIDYDNPNVISFSNIKNIFIYNFYKFISLYINISYKEFKNGVAISKSNNNQTKLHIIYSNIIMKIDDMITLMKINFKQYSINKNIYEYVDYSIYKKNFNLRLVYSFKHDKENQLIPILNSNILNHLVTYYQQDNNNKCYIIKLLHK
jgi:hypothetical protein